MLKTSLPQQQTSREMKKQPEESTNLKEASGILCEEKSQDETEPSEDVMNNKNSIGTPERRWFNYER